MKKQLVALVLLFSLGTSTLTFAKEENDNKLEKQPKVEYTIGNDAIKSDNFYIENDVKTKFILFSDIITELEKQGINYEDVFTKEEIVKLKERDEFNLDMKNKTTLYRYRINHKYNRTFISSNYAKKIITSTIAKQIPGINWIGAEIIGSFVTSFINKYDVPRECYIHNFKVSEGRNYFGITVKDINFSGWAKGKVLKNIVKEYGVNPYDLIVREPWYYIESDYAYIPEGSSGWKKINGKWYEFAEYGDLIEHSGWKKYNGKWMYHIPGDYGAYAGQWGEIDSEWFKFDSNGYCIEGRGCN